MLFPTYVSLGPLRNISHRTKHKRVSLRGMSARQGVGRELGKAGRAVRLLCKPDPKQRREGREEG